MNQRHERVRKLLLKEISKIILEEIQDPNIGFLTVVHVDLAKDLGFARVYYSVMGSAKEIRQTEEAINEHAREIKRLVNQSINLKYAIDLAFIRDEGLNNLSRVEQIFDEIKKQKPSEPAS